VEVTNNFWGNLICPQNSATKTVTKTIETRKCGWEFRVLENNGKPGNSGYRGGFIDIIFKITDNTNIVSWYLIRFNTTPGQSDGYAKIYLVNDGYQNRMAGDNVSALDEIPGICLPSGTTSFVMNNIWYASKETYGSNLEFHIRFVLRAPGIVNKDNNDIINVVGTHEHFTEISDYLTGQYQIKSSYTEDGSDKIFTLRGTIY
jgi:hypothetical protein